MGHNYEAQRRETFDTFRKASKGQKIPAEAVVDFHFFIEETDASWPALERALRLKGFKTRRRGEHLVASFGPMPVTPAAIWEREREATEIALRHDFYPDGWDLPV